MILGQHRLITDVKILYESCCVYFHLHVYSYIIRMAECEINITALHMYHQISNITHTKSNNFKCFPSRLLVVFAESIETRCKVENEYVVGAAPAGDAPTTSE